MRMDVDDVDTERMSIRLKPTAKRTNRLGFFDEKAGRFLSDWLIMCRSCARADCPALFITDSGGRINKNHVYGLVVMNAE